MFIFGRTFQTKAIMKINTGALSNFVLILVLFFFIFNTSCKKKLENSIPIVNTIEVINIEINQEVGSIGSNNPAFISGLAVGELIDNGGSQIITQGFVFSTSNGILDIENNEGTAFGMIDFEKYIKGNLRLMFFDTTYYIRAFALNDQGYGYGDILSFETPAFSEPVVRTLDPTNISAYGALLRGEVVNAGDYGLIYPREIAFCIGTEPDITVNNSFVTNGSDLQIGIFESEVSNLEISTTYYVRAIVNVGNHIYYGNEVTFTTKGYPIVEINEVTDITSAQAISGGQLIDNGGYEVTAVGICWVQNSVPTITSCLGYTEDNLVNGSFTSLLENLIGYQTYNVRAYATNEVGTAYSEVLSFKTLDACEGVSEVTDIDGNTYRVVPISGINASQCWMAENLNVSRAPDGSSIQRNCYDNSNEFCELYGGLYTWHTAMNGELSGSDKQGICPDGWQIPTKGDFTMLYLSIGLNVSGMKLKSCRQVDSPLGEDCNTIVHPRWDAYPLHYGSDNYGFSGLPGGFSGNNSFDLGKTSYYWTSEEEGNYSSYIYRISWDRSDTYTSTMMKTNKVSIRCIKEGATYGN